jgi:PD-(D/E)XK nuclease superfamily protein
VVLTTDQKGVIAELEIARRAAELGIGVWHAYTVERYDLIFDLRPKLLRVQCKWANRYGDVIVVRCYSNRRARAGLLRRRYAPEDVDAFAAYCPDVCECYLLPLSLFPQATIQLRLHPAKNNQRAGINWAEDFAFDARLGHSYGAIAQLGERLLGMQKVAGSSPAGSTPSVDRVRPRQPKQTGNPGQGVLQVVQPSLPQD